MSTRVSRIVMIAVSIAAVAAIAASLGHRAEAQAAAGSGALLVKMSPLPRDIVLVDMETPALGPGQSAVVYTVPANRHLVVTDWRMTSTRLYPTLTATSPEHWEIVEGITATKVLHGSAFDFNLQNYGVFGHAGSSFSYHSSTGVVFPPSSTVTFALLGGANPNTVARVHFEGYLSP